MKRIIIPIIVGLLLGLSLCIIAATPGKTRALESAAVNSQYRLALHTVSLPPGKPAAPSNCLSDRFLRDTESAAAPQRVALPIAATIAPGFTQKISPDIQIQLEPSGVNNNLSFIAGIVVYSACFLVIILLLIMRFRAKRNK